MIKRIRNIAHSLGNRLIKFSNKGEQPDYRLIECYNQDGIKLYKFDNPLRLPTVRRLNLFTAINDAELGMEREHIQKFCEQVKEYANANRWSDVMTLVGVLEAFSTVDYSRSLLYSMASPVIMMEGENPEEYDAAEQKRKKELFDTNPHVQAFFLRMGFVLLKSLLNSSIGHIKIEDYLKDRQAENVERMFLRLLTRNTKASSSKV